MRLYEFESKALLRDRGLSVPKGIVISSPNQIDLANQIDFKLPWYLKAQLPFGGRGKSGAVRKVTSLDQAKSEALSLFSGVINGQNVKKILIEEEVVGGPELYLSVAMNRSKQIYTIIAGTIGGMDVEEAARSHPETILKLNISPLREINRFDLMAISDHLRVPLPLIQQMVPKIFTMALELDSILAEFNPIVPTSKNLTILDAKITIDDNALFRHPEIAGLSPRGSTKEEEEAMKKGLAYVGLEGDIGIMGNGAGLTMATMDLLKSGGGSPANFLDVGAGVSSEKFKDDLNFLLLNDRIKAILINIFGGLTRCDEVAKGIIEAVESSPQKKPIVVRLSGTNEKEGKQILQEAGINAFSDPLEAVKNVIPLAGGAL
jgi:succinyl-CoA synthetase beta subunit